MEHSDAYIPQLATNVDQGLSGLLERTIPVSTWLFARHVKSREAYAARAEEDARKSPWDRAPKSIFRLPMIEPRSQFARCWAGFILLMDCTYTAFWVPLNVGFCTLDFGDLNAGCNYADLAGGSIYCLNVLLSFQIGAMLMCGLRQSTCLDGKIVASAYMRTDRFIIDLLSVIPFVYLVIILAGNIHPSRAVNIVSLIRLARMARIFSMSKIIYSEATSGRMAAVLDAFGGIVAAYILILVYVLCIVVNLEACILILVAKLEGVENSWMTTFHAIDVPNSDSVNQWYSAVYWSISTSSSTGSSGILPVTFAEMVIVNIIMLVGMVCFGMIVVTMSRFLTSASDETMMYHRLRTKLKRVHLWMHTRHIPPLLAKEVHDFFMQMWVKQKEKIVKDNVVDTLPRYLRKKVLIDTTNSLISSVQALCGLKNETRHALGNRLIEVKVAAGVHLWNEGDEPDGLWILQDGAIKALNLFGESQQLQAPCVFGEASVLADEIIACREALWTYRTTTPCTVWHLPASKLTTLRQVCPDISKTLLAYTQIKLLQGLSGWAQDGQWSEIVQRLTATFQGASEEVMDAILKQLQKCSRQDGSLQLFLDALLELSTLKKVEEEDLHEVLAVPDAAEVVRKALEEEEEEGETETEGETELEEEEEDARLMENHSGALLMRVNSMDTLRSAASDKEESASFQLPTLDEARSGGGAAEAGVAAVSGGGAEAGDRRALSTDGVGGLSLNSRRSELGRNSRRGNSTLLQKLMVFKLPEEMGVYDELQSPYRRGSFDTNIRAEGELMQPPPRREGLSSRSVKPTSSSGARPAVFTSGWSFSSAATHAQLHLPLPPVFEGVSGSNSPGQRSTADGEVAPSLQLPFGPSRPMSLLSSRPRRELARALSTGSSKNPLFIGTHLATSPEGSQDGRRAEQISPSKQRLSAVLRTPDDAAFVSHAAPSQHGDSPFLSASYAHSELISTGSMDVLPVSLDGAGQASTFSLSSARPGETQVLQLPSGISAHMHDADCGACGYVASNYCQSCGGGGGCCY